MKNYELIKPLESFSNVEIRKDGDIYELIARCENIVACYSTVVFEVLAFKKRIYVLDNKFSRNYIPKELGVRFGNLEELAEMIEKKVKNVDEPSVEYYFNANWKENYVRFIREEVGLKV